MEQTQQLETNQTAQSCFAEQSKSQAPVDESENLFRVSLFMRNRYKQRKGRDMCDTPACSHLKKELVNKVLAYLSLPPLYSKKCFFGHIARDITVATLHIVEKELNRYFSEHKVPCSVGVTPCNNLLIKCSGEMRKERREQVQREKREREEDQLDLERPCQLEAQPGVQHGFKEANKSETVEEK